MNESIKTSMSGSAQWMRYSAIATMISQGLSLVVSAMVSFQPSSLVSVAIGIALAVLLLQGANAQESYASSGNESELQEGLKKESLYWQIISILMIVVLVILVIAILALIFSGADMLNSLSRGRLF